MMCPPTAPPLPIPLPSYYSETKLYPSLKVYDPQPSHHQSFTKDEIDFLAAAVYQAGPARPARATTPVRIEEEQGSPKTQEGSDRTVSPPIQGKEDSDSELGGAKEGQGEASGSNPLFKSLPRSFHPISPIVKTLRSGNLAISAVQQYPFLTVEDTLVIKVLELHEMNDIVKNCPKPTTAPGGTLSYLKKLAEAGISPKTCD